MVWGFFLLFFFFCKCYTSHVLKSSLVLGHLCHSALSGGFAQQKTRRFIQWHTISLVLTSRILTSRSRWMLLVRHVCFYYSLLALTNLLILKSDPLCSVLSYTCTISRRFLLCFSNRQLLELLTST